MQQTDKRPGLRTRTLALVLALALVLGLLPGFPGANETAQAHWADAYLDTMVEWGFIRSDQAESPDEVMTRADFMAIINRAYGYTQTGPTPFEDVDVKDWFYDDVGIAYNANYIYGTSPTTVSPNDPLTRETAATILGRNMMLKESEGEILDFSDARDISAWARGTIKSSLEHYLVNGYDDGTFRPQNDLTWGEMAAMVTRIVGMPIQEAGDYALGGVFGNVTVSSDGVTLRDSIISGDLYITGGVGLGGVKLENVTVLGRIIASGSGESEAGEASIVLRNVIADELLVDNLQGNFVTVQANGITEIGQTTVRTDAYVEDNTPEGLGLKNIILDGEMGTRLDLAGRIETVRVMTPNAQVNVAKGTVASMTVDEAAPGTNVTIARGAVINELNLDIGTYVSGDGDIKKLNVNAEGCIVTMMPEEVYIRPGITAVINNQIMDSTAAEEASREPMILAGYPLANDVAPTTFQAVFATNKKGTVYWAVSPITDGSVATDDLIHPPTYGGISVASGSVAIPAAEELVGVTIGSATTGNNSTSVLTPGGSYYLAAVLVDDRGEQSPTKVIALTLPDDSVPAFAEGYPYISEASISKGVWTVVMPTKTCKMYYALMPVGAVAPTENELKSNSLSGALGYGVVDIVKNTETDVRVDDLPLEEKTHYDLYLWLVDADGANKSAIQKLDVYVRDETPPVFDPAPEVAKENPNTVDLTFEINEPGTLYWAVTEYGTSYPLPRPGDSSILLSDEYAKLQVINGRGALDYGNVNADTKKFTVANGTNKVRLEPETAYDLYYVAMDEAGNCTDVGHIVIHTEDVNGPKVEQYFTRPSTEDNTVSPQADTGIVLSFNEESMRLNGAKSFVELYNEYVAAKGSSLEDTTLQALIDAVSNCVVLYDAETAAPVISNTSATLSKGAANAESIEVPGANGECVLDYGRVTAQPNTQTKRMEITFPSEALNLSSGKTYYFTVKDVTDTSARKNVISPNPVDYRADYEQTGHNLKQFKVASAQMELKRITSGIGEEQYPKDTSGNPLDAVFFYMKPTSLGKVADSECYDLILWSDTTVQFDLYYRVMDGLSDSAKSQTGEAGDNMPKLDKDAIDEDTGWVRLGNSGWLTATEAAPIVGKSLQIDINKCTLASDFPQINKLSENLYYEFAIVVTQWGSNQIGAANFYVTAVAGSNINVMNFSLDSLTVDEWEGTNAQSNLLKYSVESIGRAIEDPKEDAKIPTEWLHVPKSSSDSGLPKFNGTRPDYNESDIGDTFAKINVNLNKSGYIYWLAAPVEGITTTASVPDSSTPDMPDTPDSGDENQGGSGGDSSDSGSSTTRANTIKLSDRALWPYVPTSGSMTGNQDLNKISDVTGSYVQSDWVDEDSPSFHKVMNPEELDVEGADYGQMQYNSNPATQPILIGSGTRKLLPETDYYLYIVLTDRPSPREDPLVYLYKFTTKKTETPRISTITSVSPEGATGASVSVTTDVNTNLSYIVLDSALSKNALNLLLNQEFTALIEKNLPTTYTKYAGFTYDPDNADEDKTPYTVRDALIGRYVDTSNRQEGADYFDSTYNNYSIFDLYATDSLKERVFKLISSPENSGELGTATVIGSDNVSLTAGTTTIENLNNTKAGSVYLVVTMGYNASLSDPNTEDYKIYSFKAADYVQVYDREPPAIDYIEQGSAYPGTVTWGGGQPTYSGWVTVFFDKPIYLKENENSSEIFFAAGRDQVNGNVLAKDLMDFAGRTAPTTATIPSISAYVDSGEDLPTNNFTFYFNNFSEGGQIIFTAKKLCNASGTVADNDLVITAGRNPNQDNGYLWISVRWGTKTEWFPTNQRLNADTSLNVTCTTPEASFYNNTMTLDTVNNITSANLFASLAGNTSAVQCTWTIDNTNIISFANGSAVNQVANNNNATVYARGVGTATITVSAPEVLGIPPVQISVTVKGTLTFDQAGSSNVTYDSNTGTITIQDVTQSATIAVKATPAANTSVTWTTTTTYVGAFTSSPSGTGGLTGTFKYGNGSGKIGEITAEIGGISIKFNIAVPAGTNASGLQISTR